MYFPDPPTSSSNRPGKFLKGKKGRRTEAKADCASAAPPPPISGFSIAEDALTISRNSRRCRERTRARGRKGAGDRPGQLKASRLEPRAVKAPWRAARELERSPPAHAGSGEKSLWSRKAKARWEFPRPSCAHWRGFPELPG